MPEVSEAGDLSASFASTHVSINPRACTKPVEYFLLGLQSACCISGMQPAGRGSRAGCCRTLNAGVWSR